ncbi:MAG: ABC transporter permease, partial [Planctomycetales bacterium]|nr:ABC transporter permease [Planctomycetales bacterium]
SAQWFGWFPTGVFLMLLLAGLLSLVLRYTVFGRYVFALGSNEATARLCGVNVPRTKLIVYTLAGVFFGVAGVSHFATTSTGSPHDGVGIELLVIAAVVIGGASLSGGRGSILGALAGALLMAFIKSGCVQMDVHSAYQSIILGAVLIGAAFVDQIRQRRLAMQ